MVNCFLNNMVSSVAILLAFFGGGGGIDLF